MLVTLNTPYADTTAADLSFALGLPEQPALHVLDVGVGGADIKLRLLGASHQVVVCSPELQIVETVACLPGRDAELPAVAHERAIGYRFMSRVSRLDAERIAVRVGRLRERLSDDPYALIGVFPGDPDAVTGLQVRTPDSAGHLIGWRTWHVYPQTAELVETETKVVLR
ncbi:MAG TPA: DUF2617 family protein [Micromonosporaceae bacterium]|nr:DUF2617 family protein [Micromonosporaceae bacterium]